jgi:multiple sugar transport system substrate-binding protein
MAAHAVVHNSEDDMVTRRDLGKLGISGGLASALQIRSAQAADAAATAVEAAKKYSGQTITIVWEAGLQSLDPLNFSGPKWKALTGIDVKVVEVPVAEMFTKIMQDYKSGAGAYDALNVIPSWMPDLANAGALEVLDPYVDQFGFRDELQMIAPIYRDNQMMVNGKIFGLPDDGDVFVMYYRKDVLTDPAIQKAYKDKYGSDLPVPPTNWKDFDQVGALITEVSAGKMYGAAFFREAGYGNFMFQERFRNEGGKFFDAASMKATINSEAGVKVFTDWVAENKFAPAGVEQWGFVENLAAFLQGQTAMTISWPPYGRWAANYGTDQEVMSWVPKSTIAGKVGYAMTPGGHPELAAGFCLSVSSASKNKEAAYLFIQWLNSESVSLERVKLPYALRDPFRSSHFTDPGYAALWPEAKDYLKALQDGATNGLLDLSLLQTDKYEEVLRQSVSKLWAGEDPKAILDTAAAEWDVITDKIGVDKQKAVYADWASKSGAYPKM